jgi:exonuclease SbcC
VRLHRLRVQAFQAFGGEEEVHFDALCEAGLFLVHGDTGAGKTSLLDAVVFALYGHAPGVRGGAGARHRSDHAAPELPTEVELEATLRGTRVRIVRRPRQERPKLRGGGTTEEQHSVRVWAVAEDGTEEELARRHDEADLELGRLLGMTRDQFCQVVLLPQGAFADFLRASSDGRRDVLERPVLHGAVHGRGGLARRAGQGRRARLLRGAGRGPGARRARGAGGGQRAPGRLGARPGALGAWVGELTVPAAAEEATAQAVRHTTRQARAAAEQALAAARELAGRRARAAATRASSPPGRPAAPPGTPPRPSARPRPAPRPWPRSSRRPEPGRASSRPPRPRPPGRARTARRRRAARRGRVRRAAAAQGAAAGRRRAARRGRARRAPPAQAPPPAPVPDGQLSFDTSLGAFAGPPVSRGRRCP